MVGGAGPESLSPCRCPHQEQAGADGCSPGSLSWQHGRGRQCWLKLKDVMLTAGQHLSCMPERTQHMQHVCPERDDSDPSRQLSSASFHIAGGGLHLQEVVMGENEVLLPLCNCFCCGIVLQSQSVPETCQVNFFFMVSPLTAAWLILQWDVTKDSSISYTSLLDQLQCLFFPYLLLIRCGKQVFYSPLLPSLCSSLYPPGYTGAGLEK